MQKICRTTVRRAAVFWAGLPETGEVLRDGVIAGHANLLAAANAHSIDAADYRLVTHQNRRDHVVKKAHVLLIIRRIAGVILGVLFGVASSAKCSVASSGENDRRYATVIRGFAESEDHLLNHLRRVGIVLLRIVQDDPGIE